MTEAHVQAAWDFHLFSANDLRGSVGSSVADVVQFSESARTFKATTEDGGIAEQIPDLVARIRPLWIPTQTISIHECYVVAGTTDCFRVEVCNSEDVLHGINKVRLSVLQHCTGIHWLHGALEHCRWRAAA